MRRGQATDQSEAVHLVRTIKAPAEKVYEAFLDPEQLVRWIGPGGPEATRVDSDPKVGGATDIWVSKDESEKLHFHWEIAEMDPPNRLVFDFAFGGPIGSKLSTERSRLTLEFREEGTGSTELSLVHDRLPADAVGGVDNGWKTVTDRLVKYFEQTEETEGEDSR